MIKISGSVITSQSIAIQYPLDSIERNIFSKIFSSSEAYEYDSLYQLNFELELRASIVSAARELHRSNLAFRTFRNSICNPMYWLRTNEGGFLLKNGVKPSEAITDIFINSYMYGTECATAIIIVYYKALLKIFPEELFNTLFSSIHLMNWHYIDTDLDITYYENKADYLAGDCRYFKNPEVNPLTPEWQGENVIDLGDGTYYGHGIGIGGAYKMINVLNLHRKPGATQSAFLMDSVTCPNFKYLADKYQEFTSNMQKENYNSVRGY